MLRNVGKIKKYEIVISIFRINWLFGLQRHNLKIKIESI